MMAGSERTIDEILTDYMAVMRGWVAAEEVDKKITSTLLDELFSKVEGTVSLMEMIVEDHLRQSNDRVRAKCQEQLKSEKYVVGSKESSVFVYLAGIDRTINEIMADYMAAMRVWAAAEEEYERRTISLLGDLFSKLKGPAQGTVASVMEMFVEDYLRQSSDCVRAKCWEQLKSGKYAVKLEQCTVSCTGFEDLSNLEDYETLATHFQEPHHVEEPQHDAGGQDDSSHGTQKSSTCKPPLTYDEKLVLVETIVSYPKEKWEEGSG